jgi:excisionase family DNA binding protein
VKVAGEQLLTSSEVGELLQVNPSSVKKWVDDGLLAAFRTPGGHRRIRVADLVDFLGAHKMPIPRDLLASARRRVLVVDDDLVVLKAIARGLKRFSDRIDVATSANGIDALVLVGSFQPHVVLLDIFMPGIDGLEVCRRLKKNPETRGVGVIVVSNHLTSALRKKALEAGALQCLEKPVDVERLASTILQSEGSAEARAE